MDLRTQTSLACGALALAISVSVLLRKHPRRARVFMALFAGDVGLWYLASWLYHRGQAELWVKEWMLEASWHYLEQWIKKSWISF